MKNKRSSVALALLVMFALTIIIIPAYAASTKPSLSKTKLTLYAGRSYTLKAEGFSGNVTWKTSDKKIATVSNKGKVTAKKAGTVTITAKCGKQKKTCKVTVKPVKLSKTKTTVVKGKTFTLKLYCGTTSGIKWKTSNKGVVRIISKSKNQVTLEAVKPGKATITATYKKKSYKCVVTVKKETPQTEPTPTVAPTGEATPTPAPTATPTDTPKPTESTTPTQTPTTVPTETPSATQVPTTAPTEPTTPTQTPTTEPTNTPIPTTSPEPAPTAAPSYDSGSEGEILTPPIP